MRKVPPYLLLDFWRSLAALWVVMAHSCAAFLATGDNGQFIHFPLYAVSLRGQLGVVIFFVISGYCVMGAAYGTLIADRGVGRYGADRIRRIYPPYLAACMAAIAIGFLTTLAQSHHLLPFSNHRPVYEHQPLSFWLANLLIVQSEFNQPHLLFIAWSLCYEIVFYAMIGVLLFIAQIFARRGAPSGGTQIFHFGIGGLTLLALCWAILSPVTCPFPLDRWYQFGLGALFFLAVATETEVWAWRTRAHLGLAGMLVLVLAVLSDSLGTGSGLVHDFALGQPTRRLQAIVCLIFVAILWVLKPFDGLLAHRRILRPMMWLGTISYSLYLIHTSVIAFPDAGGRRIGFDGKWYWVTYFAQIVVSIVAAWFFYLVVERHFISSRQKRRVEAELKEPLTKMN